MKVLFGIFMLVSLLYSNSNEIRIVEEVVEDITKLKNDYKLCQKDLKNRFVKTNYKELDKYKILLKNEQEKNAKMIKDMKWFTKTIETLENDLNAKKQELASIKTKQNTHTEVIHKRKKQEKIVFIKPSTFRLNSNTAVYNEIDGVKIYQWKKDRTFTSNIRSKNWIKVTGYFVDKKWQKANAQMWIKASQVYKR
jgi:predicted RND superfamily exporter protein